MPLNYRKPPKACRKFLSLKKIVLCLGLLSVLSNHLSISMALIMTNEEISVFVFLFALLWFWFASIRVKELATEAAKQLCMRAQVMILDDSVALKRLSLARNSRGSMSVKRIYRFEFASDGRERYHGKIVMLAQRVINTEMDAYRIAEE